MSEGPDHVLERLGRNTATDCLRRYKMLWQGRHSFLLFSLKYPQDYNSQETESSICALEDRH